MNSPSQPRPIDLFWPPAAFLTTLVAAGYLQGVVWERPPGAGEFLSLGVANLMALGAILLTPRRANLRARSASVALMAAALFGAVTLVANKALTGREDPSELAIALSKLSDPFDLAIAALVIVFVAPLWEEGYFRGMLYPWLSGRLGDVAGNLVSSAVFAALHPGGWTSMILLFAAVFWAVLTRFTGNVMAAMVGHMAVNAVSFAMLVGEGRWGQRIGWTDISFTGALCLVLYWIGGFWTARKSRPESEVDALAATTLYSVGMAVLISITLASLILAVPDPIL
ncbi:MAG: CPBP family intramembrane metalloprotease [Candidatus Wallbacteria bacterium]|nr:CPBP family intramembrane metalloprotease [Candidatus Wallbacteria bacterium]